MFCRTILLDLPDTQAHDSQTPWVLLVRMAANQLPDLCLYSPCCPCARLYVHLLTLSQSGWVGQLQLVEPWSSMEGLLS